MAQIELLLLAICEDQGIKPESVKGWNELQPVCHSVSPSNRSASSTGLPMEALTVADARFNASSHSSTTSERRKKASTYTELCYSPHSASHIYNSKCQCWGCLNLLQSLDKLWEAHKIVWASHAGLEGRITYNAYYRTVRELRTLLGVIIYVLWLWIQLSLAVCIEPKFYLVYAQPYRRTDIEVIHTCAASLRVSFTIPTLMYMCAWLIVLDSHSVPPLQYSWEQNTNESVSRTSDISVKAV